ncbi:hypothetical protein HAP41_0000013415 [Bradyrhizobium barranii subsp. apii]|uniref:Uncharacterized protein n=1 Tax=Bradyrhizobium barranii subsp. apii TaxID=2819348 RepID=A0A8T5VMP2_9BRAD|nr:hypothetical protein [Bradyrhizobium barranii]UPT89870.1 hypothetical protein HAP41_0000013415 [Bradyrhizobium barranii subsp. apii]
MSKRRRIIEGASADFDCLVRETQQPKGLAVVRSGSHMLIKLISQGVHLPWRSDVACQHFFQMSPRTRLVPKDVQRHSQNPLSDETISDIDSAIRQVDELFGDLQCAGEIAS